MKKKNKLLLAGFIVLFLQTYFFRDYISPFHWGQIKVKGLACTCPDESVVNGQFYLRYITPDSLKNYNIDYSEIYLSERPSTAYDPMGVDLYIVKGEIIGKDRVSEYDPWNLKLKVTSWREVNIFIDWGIKGIIIFQLFLLFNYYRKN